MEKRSFNYQPTEDYPLLIGLLVDVSGSMTSSIQNESGETINRLESFRDSLDDLISEASQLSRVGDSARIAPLVKVFAYGFGFDNPLAVLFGGGPKVRDLFDISGKSQATVTVDQLTQHHELYRKHLGTIAKEMFGTTPMHAGFLEARNRLRQEGEGNQYTGSPILFVLSDGVPTDASTEEVLEVVESIKEEGALIISCYVTDENLIESRRLYGDSLPEWPEGAKLMHECASVLPLGSYFHTYLLEHKWVVEKDSRFFTQINQSEILSEFMNVVLGPLHKTENPVCIPNLAIVRELLRAAFTAQTLRRFCQERSVLRPVCDEFGIDQGLNGMIDHVIDHCHTRLLFNELLAEIEQSNPRQYQRFRSRLYLS